MIAPPARAPNLNPAFIADVERKLGLRFVYDIPEPPADSFTPEDIFHYAYAIFHSPQFRERYAAFLKIDFPRLPLTSSVSLFRQLSALGGELVAWHLLQHPELAGTAGLITEYPIAGDNRVARGYPKHDEKSERVFINKEQYFAPIPLALWQHMVGGYQVLDKWLKDRKGRALSYDDTLHYQRIARSLSETRRLMAEIDAAIGAFPLP